LIFSKALNVTGITSTNRKSRSFAIRRPVELFLAWRNRQVCAEGFLPRRPRAKCIREETRTEKWEIIVGTTNSQKRNTYDHVTVTASDVSMDSNFPSPFLPTFPAAANLNSMATPAPSNRRTLR